MACRGPRERYLEMPSPTEKLNHINVSALKFRVLHPICTSANVDLDDQKLRKNQKLKCSAHTIPIAAESARFAASRVRSPRTACALEPLRPFRPRRRRRGRPSCAHRRVAEGGWRCAHALRVVARTGGVRPRCWRLSHQHVLELPRIALVDVLREEARATGERRPIGIDADDRAEIGRLNLEAAAEVQFVGLHDSRRSDFQAPRPCRPEPLT